MIRSGYVQQKRARFEEGFPTERNPRARDTEIRPEMKSIDGPILAKSSYASPMARDGTMKPAQKPPMQTFYRNIFSRKIAPSTRMYLSNMIRYLKTGIVTPVQNEPSPQEAPPALTTLPPPVNPSDPSPGTIQTQGVPDTPGVYPSTSSAYLPTFVDGYETYPSPYDNSADDIEAELAAVEVIDRVFFSSNGSKVLEKDYAPFAEEIRKTKTELQKQKSNITAEQTLLLKKMQSSVKTKEEIEIITTLEKLLESQHAKESLEMIERLKNMQSSMKNEKLRFGQEDEDSFDTETFEKFTELTNVKAGVEERFEDVNILSRGDPSTRSSDRYVKSEILKAEKVNGVGPRGERSSYKPSSYMRKKQSAAGQNQPFKRRDR